MLQNCNTWNTAIHFCLKIQNKMYQTKTMVKPTVSHSLRNIPITLDVIVQSLRLWYVILYIVSSTIWVTKSGCWTQDQSLFNVS